MNITQVTKKIAALNRLRIICLLISVCFMCFYYYYCEPYPCRDVLLCIDSRGDLAVTSDADFAARALVLPDGWPAHGISPNIFYSLTFVGLLERIRVANYFFITPGIRYSVWPKSISFHRPPQVSPTDSATSP